MSYWNLFVSALFTASFCGGFLLAWVIGVDITREHLEAGCVAYGFLMFLFNIIIVPD